MRLLYYWLFFFITQTSLLYASEDDKTSIILYTPSLQQSSSYDGYTLTSTQVTESPNDPALPVTGSTNPGDSGPGNTQSDTSYMTGVLNVTQNLKSTKEYIEARAEIVNTLTSNIEESQPILLDHADKITHAILSQNMLVALHTITSFGMPENLPPAIVAAIKEFNNKITHLLYHQSGNDDLRGAPRDLASINPQAVREIYKELINALALARKKEITVLYGISEDFHYRMIDHQLKNRKLNDLNKHPALSNIQISDRWWSTVSKLFWSFVDNPRKVSESFNSAIQDNHYAKELHIFSDMYADENYQSILNRLNDLPHLDQAYPALRLLAQEARDKQLAQAETLKQQCINALATNPDLAYQYTTTTQPLLTISTTEQAAPSNPIAMQAVNSDAIMQQQVPGNLVNQQTPINDTAAKPTVFAQTSSQKTSFSTEAMQAALSQAASELEAQKSDITVRFSPRLGQLVFNSQFKRAESSTPAIQAESSTSAAPVQCVDILNPAAQDLLNSCGLTSPAVHAVAPEHQLFIQQSEVVLNNAAQAHQDGIASDVVIAETIILTRTAQELELAGHSDKANALLAIAEKKCNNLTVPNAQDSNWYYMSDPCDDAAAELAAFQSFGRIFGHTGHRIVHNVKHPMEFVHRQVDGLKNLTLLAAKSLHTTAKFLSEEPDLFDEAWVEVKSAAHVISESVKSIVAMSEQEREEFFGNLIGDSLVDMAGLKAANAARQSTRCISSAVIEGAAQTFKGNTQRIPLYDNAVKKIPKPAPLEAFYDPKTNSWRVPDASFSTVIQKSTGLKAPGTSMTPARIVSGTCKMPPPPKFTNPHSVSKRTKPATSTQTFPAIAASSSAGSKQGVSKVTAPVASSSGTGQPANTTQQPLAEAGQATGELKTTSDAFSLTEHGWNLSENGSMINGRYYSKHALERMAPRTPEVMAILEKRAHARNFEEYDDFLKYVQPREIPPMVIEDAIKNGAKSIGTSKYGDTLIYITDEIKVITNLAGDVVSVYRI